MQDERKPDLSGPDYEELEKKVKEMLDPITEKPVSSDKRKKIEIDHKTDEEPKAEPKEPEPEKEDVVATAPPVASKKIEISHHDDEVAEAPAEKTEEKPPISDESKDPETAGPNPETETAGDQEPADEVTEDEVEETEAAPEEPGEKIKETPEVPEEPKPAEPEEEPDVTDAPEDPEIDKAVDDIVAKEGDELLAAEDEKIAKAFEPQPAKSRGKFASFFAAWWGNKKARWATIIVMLLAVAAVLAWPSTRYTILNTVGVRSSSSITVLDESTQQPLKGVTVTVAGVSGQTDDTGTAKLTQLKLGKTTLVVSKRAFAEVTKPIVVGWGSNPMGSASIKPVGLQYAFVVTDFLSGKPIQKVEAVSGEASAFSDEQGKIKLTVGKDEANGIEVTLQKSGLRTEKFTQPTQAEHAVKMVPARQHVFISKRSGKYDVYKVDVDGKNEQVVLAGTGKERDDMVLVQHPSKDVVALVSTRTGKRNADGFLLSTLTTIDLNDNSTQSVSESERVQVVDWAGDKLVYVQIAAGTSAANPKRHRLMSYDYTNQSSKELASSNYFNDVLFVSGKLYYAPSSAYQNGVNVSFFRVNPDGSDKQIIFAQEVWNAFRSSYDHLVLTKDQQWYDYTIGSTNKPTKLDGSPANLTNRLYVDAPDGKHALWVDTRDGKGVLLSYDTDEKKDTVLKTQSGLKNPVYWLDDSTVVYRVSTPSETADYAMSLNGGEARKIRDVSDTGGVDKWYYY